MSWAIWDSDIWSPNRDISQQSMGYTVHSDECMALDRFNANLLYLLGRDLSTIAIQARRERRIELIEPIIRAKIYLDAIYSTKVLDKPLLPLKTSATAANTLGVTLEKLADAIKTEQFNDPFTSIELGNLTQEVQTFQTVLSADLGRAATYVVRQLGILDVDSLIFNASNVFEGYLERIPESSIWDTEQAGRCMAFDLPTAAGFHVARATEAVLLKYMNAFGVAPAKESQRNWGQYTRLLREQVTGMVKPAERVLSAIDQIRILHRNPLLHPEQSLTMPEALSLWAICCSTIQAMIADMEQKEAAPKAEILGLLPPEQP